MPVLDSKVSAIGVGGRRSVVSGVEDEEVAWKDGPRKEVQEPDVPMSSEESVETTVPESTVTAESQR